MTRILLFVLLTGCPARQPLPPASAEPAPAPTFVPEPEAEAKPTHAPRPFTAEQIADAFQPGLTILWHFEEGDTERWQQWEVLDADASGMRLATRPTNELGVVTGPAAEAMSTWVEARDHATFPADRTTLDEVHIYAVGGARRALRYTIRGGPDDPPGQVSTYWFATDLAGPPVLMEVTVGEDRVFRMQQVQRDPLAPPAGPP